jgi:hypothetical protein
MIKVQTLSPPESSSAATTGKPSRHQTSVRYSCKTDLLECLNVGPAVPNPSLDLLIRRTASLRPLIRKGASRELPTFGQLSVRKELNVIPARSACRGNRTVPVTALAGVPSITTSPTTTPFFRTGCCPDATRQ